MSRLAHLRRRSPRGGRRRAVRLARSDDPPGRPHTPQDPAAGRQTGETNLVSVEGSKSVVFHDLNDADHDRRRADVHAARRVHRELLCGQARRDGPRRRARRRQRQHVAARGARGRRRQRPLLDHRDGRAVARDLAGGIGLDTANYFYSHGRRRRGRRPGGGRRAARRRRPDPPRRRDHHRLGARRRAVRQPPHGQAGRPGRGRPDHRRQRCGGPRGRSRQRPTSTPATASRTASIAAVGCSTGPRSTWTSTSRSPAAPRSPADPGGWGPATAPASHPALG